MRTILIIILTLNTLDVLEKVVNLKCTLALTTLSKHKAVLGLVKTGDTMYPRAARPFSSFPLTKTPWA